jgi:cytochrome c oxidase subunit 4
VATYYVDVGGALVPTLIGLSIVKFTLVVLWFMHLKFDSPTYARFFLMGLAGAATLYLIVLITFGIFGVA